MTALAEREPVSRSWALLDGQRAKLVCDERGDQTVLFERGDPWESSRGPEAPFRVYVPYTVRRSATMRAAPTNAVWVDVSASPFAYYAALTDWWAKGETFMVIEHDVVVTPEIIAEMDESPEPWATYWYSDCCHVECREGWRNLLGCTRFRAELIRAVPDAASAIPPDNWDWHNVCDGLGANLRAAGFSHSWLGEVVHRHEPLAPLEP